MPTPDVAVAPDQITVGYYVRVVNTQNIGVTVRGGPSTDNVRILVAPEETLMLVIAGPTENDDFTWWQVQLEDGTEGWVSGPQFLEPDVARPNCQLFVQYISRHWRFLCWDESAR